MLSPLLSFKYQNILYCVYRGILYIIVPIGTPGGVPAVPILQEYMPYILGLKSFKNVCTTLVIFDQFFSPTKLNKVNLFRELTKRKRRKAKIVAAIWGTDSIPCRTTDE